MIRALDAHAHLHDPQLAADLDAVIARSGLDRILSCGEDITTSERTLEIARRHPTVRVAAGVHPHRAASWSEDVAARLRLLAQDELVVAIGEMGVDLSGRSAPPDVQVVAFEAQLRLARELDLPAVVHVRDAGDLALEVVDRVDGVRGMIHCFSEGPDAVAEWTTRGFYISYAGPLTYPKNEALRAAARITPADRLLVETDAPYLAPQGHRGSRNEPAFVHETLVAMSDAHHAVPGEIGARIAENAARLFGPRWLGGTT